MCGFYKMSLLSLAVVLLAGLSCISAKLGTPTTVEEYPSIVQVENRVGALWLQQCAASVLTSYHVLSAASCFTDVSYSVRNRRIRAGTSYRGVGGSVAEVYTAYNHPTFGGALGNDGDLTVVRLVSSLPLGDNIDQAAILGEGIVLPAGLGVTLVGWGTTAEGGLIGNDDLYSLSLKTVDNDKCLDIYLDPEDPETITENMLCVGLYDTDGRDLDSRDAGTPVFYTNVTIGVVSFGVSRGDDEFPVVTTAISSYTAWIVNVAATL